MKIWSLERPEEPETETRCTACGWQGRHAPWSWSDIDPGHMDSYCAKCRTGRYLRIVYRVDRPLPTITHQYNWRRDSEWIVRSKDAT